MAKRKQRNLATKHAADARWRRTAKGKAAAARFRRSAAGRAASRRWYLSPKGRAAFRRLNEMRRARRFAAAFLLKMMELLRHGRD
jgi:hypothetical protein